MAVTRLARLGVLRADSARCLCGQASRHLITNSTSSFSSSANGNGSIQSEKKEVNGVQLHYEKTGSGDHAVFLLPGALGCSRTDFGPQLEKLNKEKFTVFCWDPRGYGKSRPPDRDWPLDFYGRDAEDATALIKALGLSQVSLLGWSDGGNTALIMAGRYPELCRKLVVWGSNTYVCDKDIEFTEAIRDINKWSDGMKKPFIDVYGEAYFCEQWGRWVDAFHRIKHKNNGNVCRDQLPKIVCPTLIIHGQLDPIVVQEHPDYIHANIRHSRLVNWPKAKHNLHLRYADDFNKTVEDFLLDP
ncbi:valacyclovir hydrolase-like [Liolophura sinensis]|uniref:valacyclovir hydrolase-like n=1 Tax=Liolophura sinensis TaxID=3198878 RepID=UPI003158B806